MPRTFVHCVAIHEQLNHKIEGDTFIDAEHAAASLGADAFVTEDKSLYAVLKAIKPLEPTVPEAFLAVRATPSAVAAVQAALDSP